MPETQHLLIVLTEQREDPRIMPDPMSDSALETEFHMLAARAGVPIPEARMPAILLGYADFRSQLELLRGTGRDHTAEWSNIFRMLVPGANA